VPWQALLTALALERLTAGVLLPLVAVLAKWAIIGRSPPPPLGR